MLHFKLIFTLQHSKILILYQKKGNDNERRVGVRSQHVKDCEV